MDAVLESNLKLFRTSALNGINWREEISDLKVLVLAILAASQEDLIITSTLTTMTTEELSEATDIIIEKESINHEDVEYEIDTITLHFPEDFFKPQSFSFITASHTTAFSNSLILVKCSPKMQNLIFQWLKNKHGLIIRSLRFEPEFIIDILQFTINGLVTKSKLGDVDLQFQTRTYHGALNAITLEVSNCDIIEFSNLEPGRDLIDTLYDYFQAQTSIDFKKLKISKLRCNFLVISADGKLRFLRSLPKLEATDEIQFSMWDFLHRIYGTLS